LRPGCRCHSRCRLPWGKKRFYGENGKISRQRSSTAERSPFQVGPAGRSSSTEVSAQVTQSTHAGAWHHAKCRRRHHRQWSTMSNTPERSPSTGLRITQRGGQRVRRHGHHNLLRKVQTAMNYTDVTNRLSETRTAWKQDHPSLPDLALELERVLERPTATSTKKLRTG